MNYICHVLFLCNESLDDLLLCLYTCMFILIMPCVLYIDAKIKLLKLLYTLSGETVSNSSKLTMSKITFKSRVYRTMCPSTIYWTVFYYLKYFVLKIWKL